MSTELAIETLCFNAEVTGRRFVVTIGNEYRVALPFTSYEALLTLATSRLSRSNGYTLPHELCDKRSGLHKVISRLRQDIDDVLGIGSGVRLIHHVGRSVYTLELPSDGISVADDAEHLPEDQHTRQLIQRLRNLCRLRHGQESLPRSGNSYITERAD